MYILNQRRSESWKEFMYKKLGFLLFYKVIMGRNHSCEGALQSFSRRLGVENRGEFPTPSPSLV